MRMGSVAWDGPGGWETDGMDGMGWVVLGCATERGSLPSVMREPSAVLLCYALPICSVLTIRACPTAPKRGVETMFS